MTKKKIYISYDGTDKIANYAEHLSKSLPNYAIKYRKQRNELYSKNIESISSSNLFIAIANLTYFDCQAALDEFKYALDTQRPIFRLLSNFVSKPDERIKILKNSELAM